MDQESKKSRFIQLMWTSWAFSLVGLDNGIVGPTLLDLASNVEINPEYLTIIFPIHGLGYVIGITLSSFILKLNHLHLSFAIILLLGIVVNILIPLSKFLVWLVILCGLQGTAKGLLDIFAYTLCLRLFPQENGWPMLVIPILSSFFSFIIPFMVQPFQGHWVIPEGANVTLTVNCTLDTCIPVPSQIIIPYSITSLIVVPPMIAFFTYAALKNFKITSNYDILTKKGSFDLQGLKSRWLMILLLFLFHIPAYASIIGYSDLLTLYGTSKPIPISKSEMAYMTALFWGLVFIGRILNMLIAKFLDLELLLRVNFAGLILASVILLVHHVTQIETILWVGTAFYGFFQCSFLPSVIAWVGTFMELDVVILFTSLIASGIGEIIVPYVESMTFHDDGHNELMYLVFIISFIQMILFISMSVHKYYRQRTWG